MKNFEFLLVLILIMGFFSCDNELDLIADYKDIPVVYGLLDRGDTAQYIRVEKAFVDPSTSANVLAQIPDSLYYENVDVRLIRESNGEQVSLSRVDGNQEGYVRQEGVFATAPNYLYKVLTHDFLLVDGEDYRLEIDRGEGTDLVTATTTLLEPTTITRPSNTGRMDFDYVQNFNVKWIANDDALINDVNFVMSIREVDITDPSVVKDKVISWRVGKNIEGDELERQGIDFYGFMAGALNEDPNVARFFRGMDVVVVSGGADILEYVRVGQANLGITSSQDVPRFSNLSEGVGLFSSRSKSARSDVQLTAKTLDSLRNGQITQHLNFR